MLKANRDSQMDRSQIQVLVAGEPDHGKRVEVTTRASMEMRLKESPELGETVHSVSVIIPFSRPDKVGNAIESVLSQDYPQDHLEIIVVGKGSDDLRKQWPGIRTIDQGPIREPGRARNLGAEIATGDFLLFLDDDCEAQRGWIHANLAELENQGVGAVGGMIEGKSKAMISRSVDYANFGLCQIPGRQERPICSASFGIRRSLLNEVDGFDDRMQVHEDIDLCHRLEKAGYTTVYQADVKVLHDHGRATLRSMVEYMFHGGKVGGLSVEERYRDSNSFYDVLLRFKHPLVYFPMVLPFAVGATLQTIKVNFKEHKDVFWLSPFIFLGKLSCHLGIWSSLFARQLRGSWVTHGAAENVKVLLKYSLMKRSITTPRQVTLFVTSQCNARCQHCFYWKSLNQRNDLSFDEIAELSHALGKIDKLLVSGGEPFLRKDLPEISQMFFRNNDLGILSIPTNGLRPDLIRHQARRILEVAAGRMVNISLSIDGLADVHDELRGVPGSFDRACETYKALHGMQGQYGNLSLRANCVVTNQSYASILALMDKIPSLLPGVNVPALTLLRGDPSDKSLALPSLRELRLLHNHKMSQSPGYAPWAWRAADWANFTLSLETLIRNTQVVPCEAGRISGVIEEDGDVKHCEMLPAIGNLRTSTFTEIWNSPRARQERERIVNKGCYCTHECNLFPSFMAHPIKAGVVLARALLARS